MKPIPGRPLIPLITDLLEYRPIARDTINYTRRMREKYGDVCECSFTGIKSYFVHDPDVIKEMLATQGPKMKRTYFFRAFRKFLGQGLFTSDGELHKEQRKLIKPAFYPERVQEYANIMVRCAEEEISTWKDGETININQAMTRITMKVITQSMFGSGIENEVIAQVGRDMQATLEVINHILRNPFYVYCLIHDIRIPIVKRFYRYKHSIDKVVNDIIASYRRTEDSSRRDLLSMLMEARDEETGTGMSNEQVRDEVMTFFLAGHETTTLALTWTLYLLARHPEIADSMHAEIKQVIGNRLPQASDYQMLHYTRNIFRESLRLYPPAWTIARETREDMVIKDYHFSKGSVLWTVTYLLHHDEKYFHDAERFIPDRWDEEDVKNLPKYVYFPFGGGNRMCIGEGFAWMEGVLVLATIGRGFRFTLKNSHEVGLDPVFTLRTKEDVTLGVFQRQKD